MAANPLSYLHQYLRQIPASFDPGSPPAGALRLDLNEGPYGPTPSAALAIQRVIPSLNRYPDPAARELRERLAGYHDVSPGMILFAGGSNSVGSALLRCTVGPGRKVVYPWPGFPTFGMTANRLGATPVPVTMRDDGSDDLDALAAASVGAAIVFLATPANPTGQQVVTGLREFVEEASKHALVVIDEAYHEYGEPCLSGLDLVREGFPIVCMRTFSKVWASPAPGSATASCPSRSP